MNETTAQQIKRPALLLIATALILCLSLMLWWRALEFAPFGADSSYILGMAHKIASGWVPFRDLGVQHTTASMFLYAGVEKILGARPSLEQGLWVVTFVTALCLLPISIFCRLARWDNRITAFVLALAIFCFYLADGFYVNIEPFVLLPGLLAQLLFLNAGENRSKLVLTGILAGIAFCFKQYGLFILGAILVESLVQRRILRQTPFLAFGFGCIVVVYYWQFAYRAGASIPAVFSALNGSWYDHRPERFLLYLKDLLTVTPWILFVPFIFRKAWKQPVFRICLFSLLLTMCQGLVRQYMHYILHAVPYAVILAGYLVVHLKELKQQLLVWILCVPLVGYRWDDTELLFVVSTRGVQHEICHQMNTRAPQDSKVLLFASPAFYLVCGYEPVDYKVPGYNFLDNYSLKDVERMLEDSQYVFIRQATRKHFESFIERVGSGEIDLRELLIRKGFAHKESFWVNPPGVGFDFWTKTH